MTNGKVVVKAKPIWLTKTFWVGIAVALLPFAEEVHTDLGSVIQEDWILSVVGGLIVLLRLVTKLPATLTTKPEGEAVDRP